MTTTLERPQASAELVARLRTTFASGRTTPEAWRRRQLDQLVTMIEENLDDWHAALHADLGKSATEAYLTETGFTVADLRATLRSFADWMRPQRVPVPLTSRPGKAYVHAEPLGVALIIAPWNYPLQLLLAPLGAAIAAGCCAVVKPSELAPTTSALAARLLARYLDPEAYAVVEGGVPETTALLEQRWDTIFYTGNGTVGRVVMHAAAQHLTPVTLELGGKSPAIVADDADVEVAARRIAWGKFVNAGQTCVAPDHVFVQQAVHERFLASMAAAITEMYGAQPRASADYGRIVNDHHFARLTGLLDGGGYRAVTTGGERDAASRYLAPTVVDDVEAGAPLMGEEIFGPILPVIPVASVDDAVGRVGGDRPLALYVFTGSDETAERVRRGTSSGGMLVNHTLLHLGVPGLPFGGVGESGIGSYHGRAGFDAFSHRRSVLRKPQRPDVRLMYPPYTKIKDKLLRRLV